MEKSADKYSKLTRIPLFNNSRGVPLEERIDIHTQTNRKARSANPYLQSPPHSGPDDRPDDRPDESAECDDVIMDDDDEGMPGISSNGLYDRAKSAVDNDMEWKTQSLPSLGRVSSEQTLESSGDEFAAMRRAAPTRMMKSRNVSSS